MFDEIPQDKKCGYPCSCGGSITQDDLTFEWFCNSCNFIGSVTDIIIDGDDYE